MAFHGLLDERERRARHPPQCLGIEQAHRRSVDIPTWTTLMVLLSSDRLLFLGPKAIDDELTDTVVTEGGRDPARGPG